MWGDGQSMPRERCLEPRQWYTGLMDAEKEMEGEEVLAQLPGMS